MNVIPPEVTRMIYEYADDEELAKLCMLNKNFHNKVCNSSFWVKKIMDRYGLSPEEIKQFRGNNTVSSYYTHLGDITKNYINREVRGIKDERLAGLNPKYIERIYHSPEFKLATDDMFKYEENPKWLIKSIFEEEFLYRFIIYILSSYRGVYQHDVFRTGDIGTYRFLIGSRLTISPELKSLIISQLNEALKP